MGIFSGLQIGAKALSAYNVAMQLIGHNIANAQTEGYTRQRTQFITSQPDVYPFGTVGTGVDIGAIQRIRDSYLDTQMYREKSALEKWSVRSDYLTQLELYFNESSDTGISSMLDGFWQGWSDLANAPEDQIGRVSLIQQTLTFTNSLNNIYEKTKQLRLDIDKQIETGVEEINTIATEIAALNTQILNYESGGNSANDLRDQRDLLVSQLSELIDFNVYEQANGTININIEGKQLVSGAQTSALTTASNPDNDFGLVDIEWADNGVSINPASGELGGLLYARDTIIPKYINFLDTLSQNLIIEVNKLHSQGRGLVSSATLSSENAVSDATAVLGTANSGLTFYNQIASGSIWVHVTAPSGTVTSTQITVDASTMKLLDAGDPTHSLATLIDNVTGIDSATVDGNGILNIQATSGYTFTICDDSTNPTGMLMALGINNFFSGEDVSDITVSSTLQADPDLLAAALSTNPGDNANARALADLKYTTITGLSGTFNDYYNADIVAALGVEANEVNNMAVNQNLIVEQLKDSIQKVSGVSLDEEMTTLIQYQHAYTAAAKYITLSQEMLDALVNIL